MSERLKEYQTIEGFVIFEQKYNETIEKMSSDLNSIYQYARKLETDLKSVQTILPKKAEQLEVKRMWKNFENYCSYQDLKDLYGKVMPTLATYDQKME